MFPSSYCSKNKTWQGADFPLMYHRDVTVGNVLLTWLSRYDNRVMQIHHDENTVLTASDLKIRTIRCAIQLQKRGIKMGDCVGLIAKNTTNIAPVVFATLTIGAPFNPLDLSFSVDDIVHMFSMTQPKIVFVEHDIVDRLKEALRRLKSNAIIVTVGKRIDGCELIDDFIVPDVKEKIFIPPKLENGEKHPAIYVCSSGTTGYPKGVALSHAHVLHKMSGTMSFANADVYLSFSSLYWLTGCGILINVTINGMTRIQTTQPFSPDLWFEIVEKYKVTLGFFPPAYLGIVQQSPRIENVDLSSVGLLFIGGSVLPQKIHEGMAKYLPKGFVANTYAMSETAGIIAISINVKKTESVGQPLPDVIIKIIDSNGVNLGPGEKGEICVKSKFSFIGYVNNPEATKAALSDDGWLRTGDIGYFDDDNYLYVVDRLKEILKYKNFQISPSEVENLIMKIDGVRMAVVVGIPDLICTDLPAALVIRNDPNITAEQIYNFVAEKVADAKKLRGGIYFVDKYPLSPSGKILKVKAKEIAIVEYEKAKTGDDKFLRNLLSSTA